MDAIPSIIPFCVQPGNGKQMGIYANNEYIVFLLYPLSIGSSALAVLGGTIHAELKDCASGNVGMAAKERVGAIVDHVLLSAMRDTPLSACRSRPS